MKATEYYRNTKIGDLEMALVIQEQVLWLDVTMCNPATMQICNTLEKLLEETQLIVNLEVAMLEERK